MDEPASFFVFDDIDWADERAGGATAAPAALIAAAQRSGARRKRMVTGQAGYFMNHSVMPADFEVPMHSHDHNELIVVVAGGCTMLGDGQQLGPNDAMTFTAGHEYGFRCGAEGMAFLTIRTGESSVSMKP
jgi:quercetin dioxygenase-like cupin family protein